MGGFGEELPSSSVLTTVDTGNMIRFPIRFHGIGNRSARTALRMYCVDIWISGANSSTDRVILLGYWDWMIESVVVDIPMFSVVSFIKSEIYTKYYS